MKVLKAKVNWMDGFANDPELQVLVDHLPDQREIVTTLHIATDTFTSSREIRSIRDALRLSLRNKPQRLRE